MRRPADAGAPDPPAMCYRSQSVGGPTLHIRVSTVFARDTRFVAPVSSRTGACRAVGLREQRLESLEGVSNQTVWMPTHSADDPYRGYSATQDRSRPANPGRFTSSHAVGFGTS